MTIEEGLLGREYEERFVVSDELVDRFAALSGDRNPIHMDALAAREHGHPRRVAHGVISLAVLSRLIGMRIPGPGALWLRQRVEWPAPVYVGDEVVVRAVVSRHSTGARMLELRVEAVKQDGTVVMRGEAEVRMPARMTRPASPIPATSSVTTATAPRAPDGPRERVAEKDVVVLADLARRESGTAGRVALVTGGSRGLGLAIARSLATHGHSVALNYHRSGSAADALVSELGVGRAHAFAADVADPGQIASLTSGVLERFGQVDVVVHCATPPLPKRAVAELTRDDLAPYWRTYVEAAVDLVRALSPGMRERGFGRFVFVGTSAMFGLATTGWSSYLIAKHALYGLVRSLAVELGPSGITTNMISPGMMVTDLTADVPARAKEVEAHRSPLRRLAAVDDAAELVAFLASDAAAYLNGANIPLTGGPI